MGRIFRIIMIGISALLFGIVSGCATTTGTTPDWITGVDGAHPGGRRIVAYGRDSDRDAAVRIARDDARRQVEHIIIQSFESEGVVLTEVSARLIEIVAARRSEALEEIDTFTRVDRRSNYESYLLFLYSDIDRSADLGWIRDEEIAILEAEPIETVFPRIRELLDRPLPVTPAQMSEILTEARTLSGEVRIRFEPDQQTVRLGVAPARSVEGRGARSGHRWTCTE